MELRPARRRGRRPSSVGVEAALERVEVRRSRRHARERPGCRGSSPGRRAGRAGRRARGRGRWRGRGPPRPLSTGTRMARSQGLPVGAIRPTTAIGAPPCTSSAASPWPCSGVKVAPTATGASAPATASSWVGEHPALGERAGEMGDEGGGGADDRLAVEAVAEGDRRDEVDLRVGLQLREYVAAEQRRVGGLQVDGGEHHADPVAGRGDDQVELRRRRGRCPGAGPAPGRSARRRARPTARSGATKSEVGPAEAPEQRADQRPGAEAAQ